MRAPNPESRSAMVQQVQIVPEGAALFSLSRSRYLQIVLRYDPYRYYRRFIANLLCLDTLLIGSKLIYSRSRYSRIVLRYSSNRLCAHYSSRYQAILLRPLVQIPTTPLSLALPPPTSNMTESELRIPILLTHGNWKAWKASTSTKLKSESLWGLIDGWNTIPATIPLPTSPTDAANAAGMVAYRSDLREYRHNKDRILHWRQTNEKAEGFILRALDQDELNTLPEYNTAMELWTHLSTKHKEEYTGLAGYYLFYCLLRTPYNDTDDMQKHVSYLRSQNELLGQSDPTQKFSSEMMGFILITSVSPSDKEWNGIISNLLANATPSKKITFDDVATRFTLEYDQRSLRTTAESNELNALAVKLAAHAAKVPSRSKRPMCEHCGRSGHVKDSCWTLYPEQRVSRGRDKASPKTNARIAKAQAELKAAMASADSESEEEQVANLARS